LYINDSVESSPASAQGDVHLELDVHKDETTNEADGDDDQLGPERPLQITFSDFIRCSVDEYIQRPNDAGDGDGVKSDGAHNFPSLYCRHLKLLPFLERFDFRLHDELKLA